MLTRPKLIDPFQIVRMGVRSNSRGTGRFRPPPALPFLYDADRDDRVPDGAPGRVPDRRRARPPPSGGTPSRRAGRRPPISRSRRTAGARSRGRRPASGSTRSRAALLARGVRTRRRRRGRLAHAPRVDPARLGDHVDRRRRRRALPDEHRRASARTSSATPRLCSPSPRTKHSARSSHRCAQLPELREIVGFDELAAFDGETAALTPSRSVSRGRPRDAHLHVGHDRPAEGLHALAQEPRDGRVARETHIEGDDGHGAPLPADGAQLRADRASVGGVPRRDARALRGRRPACPRRSPATTRRSCRPCRASTRRSTRTRWARSSGRAAPSARSAAGRSASARARAGCAGRDARCRPCSALQQRDRGQARLLEGARAARRPFAARRLRRGAARHRRARVLPLARTCS